MRLVMASILGVSLTACGGGGGASSTPTPPIAAPTPTPTPTPPPTIADLQQDETFSAKSGFASTTFNLDTGAATATQVQNRNIEISYDVDSNSYTLTDGSRSINFADADIVASESVPGRTTYQRDLSNNEAERFLLLTTPSEGESNEFVGLGVWQSILINGNSQESDFDIFVFGFDTPFQDIPLTGTISYATDFFGLLTFPDDEPRALVSDGLGTFTIDLGTGAFAASNILREFELRPGGGLTGALTFDAAGYLSSSENSFSGTFFYIGGGSRTFGEIEGKFFGPDLNEVGAVFSGVGRNGFTLNGGLTGQRDDSSSSLVLASQPLPTNYQTSATAFSFRSSLTRVDYSGGPAGRTANLILDTNTIRLTGGTTAFPAVDLNRADADTNAQPGYQVWNTNGSTSTDDFEIEVVLNDPENGGVELTYLNFVVASYASSNEFFEETTTNYQIYGLPTARGVLLARTGTAQYSGIVVAEAANTDSGNRYDVSGTSLFVVDFTNDTVGGNLTMAGTKLGETNSTPFGVWTIDGQLALNFGHLENIELIHESSAPGEINGFINAEFYGPNGEEIGGTFEAVLPAGVLGEYLNIGGITVATQD